MHGKIVEFILFLLLLFNVSNIFAIDENDLVAEKAECMSFISELMPLDQDTFTEEEKVQVYSVLCDKTYENYGFYFQHMTTKQLDEAAQKLKETLENIFSLIPS